MTDTATSTPLTDDETRRASQTLAHVPMIGLASMPYAANVDDLLRQIASIGDALGKALRDKEALDERMRELQHERHTIRKFLGTSR